MLYFYYLLGTFIPKAFASSPYQPYCDALGTYCGAGNVFIVLLLDRAVMIIFQLIGGTSVIAVIVGGLKMTFMGEEGKEDAKKIITYALFGIALAVVGVTFARFICQFAAFAFGENAAELCSIT